jgi:Spy/CpxP family protein refolding chaperone
MKKVLGFAVAAMMLAGGSSVFAGAACCAAGKAKSEAKVSKAGCGDIFAKLDLTEEQRAELEALKAECDEAGCTIESREKFMSGLKEILTPEQLEQCKALCEKAKGSACPFMKGESKS